MFFKRGRILCFDSTFFRPWRAFVQPSAEENTEIQRPIFICIGFVRQSTGAAGRSVVDEAGNLTINLHLSMIFLPLRLIIFRSFIFHVSEPPAGPFFLFVLSKRKNRRRKRNRLGSGTAKEGQPFARCCGMMLFQLNVFLRFGLAHIRTAQAVCHFAYR